MENLKNPYLEGILKQVKEEQKRIEQEQKAADEHYAKALKEADKKEGELQVELDEKYALRDRLISEFEEIEKEALGESKKAVDLVAVSKAKVIAGEKTLADFFREGKDEKAMMQDSIKMAVEKLDRALDVLRSLNAEIFGLELSLAQTKVDIHSYILQPGKAIVDTLGKLKEFAERQVSFATDGYPSAAQELKNLTEKKSKSEGRYLSAGYAWPAVTVEEARRTIPFDPVLPREFVPKFYEIIERLDMDNSGPNPQKIAFTFFHRDKNLTFRIVR